jgi:hypothetical protein
MRYFTHGQVLFVDESQQIELLLLVNFVVSATAFFRRVHGLRKEGRTLNNREIKIRWCMIILVINARLDLI